MRNFELNAVKRSLSISFDFEDQAIYEGYEMVAGVDEVGRGCLAGPVVAAACILDRTKTLPAKLNDSKKLSARNREEIAEKLKATAVAISIAEVDAADIDRINILQATKIAMAAAINGLKPTADYLLIDALQLKEVFLPQKALIKGDAISYSIAAASIIAKTYRDDLMKKLDTDYPQYGFAKHAGYGTAAHFSALKEFGPCPIHRLSFRGVVQIENDPI